MILKIILFIVLYIFLGSLTLAVFRFFVKNFNSESEVDVMCIVTLFPLIWGIVLAYYTLFVLPNFIADGCYALAKIIYFKIVGDDDGTE